MINEQVFMDFERSEPKKMTIVFRVPKENRRHLHVLDFASALLAEFRFAFQFGPASFAMQSGIHRLTAFRAELAVGYRPAVCTRNSDNRLRVGGFDYRIN